MVDPERGRQLETEVDCLIITGTVYLFYACECEQVIEDP